MLGIGKNSRSGPPIGTARRYRGGRAGELGGWRQPYKRPTTPADGRFAEAPADFTRAIELDPQRANVYRLRGVIYMDVGETTKAETDYEKAGQLGFPEKQ